LLGVRCRRGTVAVQEIVEGTAGFGAGLLKCFETLLDYLAHGLSHCPALNRRTGWA